MIFKILADLFLVAHFAFILFAIFGGLLVLIKSRWAWIHIPTVLWAALVNVASWICPLTPLEIKYRIAAGQAGYEEGFVEHYIAPLVYPEIMTRQLELFTGILVFAWNVLIYIFVIQRWKKQRISA